MDQYIDREMSIVTDDKKIKDEIFFPFKLIGPQTEPFIRNSKTIICYEIHLPFILGFKEGYEHLVRNKEILFVYSEKVRHEHMKSIMKCYSFFKEPYNKIDKTTKGFVMSSSVDLINNIIKINKSKYGNMDMFLLNSSNMDYSATLFTYDTRNKLVTHGAIVINEDSIYHPIKPEQKTMYNSEEEYNYLKEKLEESKMDNIIDAFYYLCIAKENEIEKNYNFAVINLQTGIEIFMYNLFNKLVENGMFSEPKGGISKLSYKNLLQHHLKKALETRDYKFDLSVDNNDLYNYWQKLYLVRNKIVHEGYTIPYNEYIEETRPACDQLIKGISKIISNKYPFLNIKINY